MNLRSLKLEDLSKIRIEFFSCPFPETSHLRALVITFEGEYGYGSKGNGDALYMTAMIKAGLAAWRPHGLILDFQQLTYEWGDMMLQVLESGSDFYFEGPLPTAVIRSSKNQQGLTSLVRKEMRSIFFDSLEPALVDLERQIIKRESELSDQA